jgi:hypothetical protein
VRVPPSQTAVLDAMQQRAQTALSRSSATVRERPSPPAEPT